MATNEIRLHEISFRMYNEGNVLLGVATVDMPEFNFKTTDVSGAGILGEYSSPVLGHPESMEITLHYRTLNGDSAKFMRQRNGLMLSLRGRNQNYDAGVGRLTGDNVRLDVRGLPKSLSLGKFEPGETSDTELTLELDILKLSVNGKVLINFDRFNYIYEVDGVDYLSELREGLGL